MAETRFIVAGNLIDGSGADVRRNVFLEVEDGIIAAIGFAADLPRNDGAAIDDFSHCTLLPALVDCSVSLSQSPSVDSRVRSYFEESGFEKKAALFERHIRDCHAHGVLGVADSGDVIDLMEHCQKGMAQGNIIDIRTSGSLGCDFFKICYSCTVEDEQAPSLQLNHETLRHILLQHSGKRKVVVANGQQAVRAALEAGCDAIEQGYLMGEDNLRKMAEQGVLWIPSVLRAKNALDSSGSGGEVCCRFSLRYVAPGKALPGAEIFWKKMLADQLMQLRLARKLGVTTAVGTGAGSTGLLHGESMVEEMKLFIKAGYSLEETIRCASDNGARFFGMEQLGTLTVGRNATFLVTRGTAHQLPRKLSYLEGIYVAGAPSGMYRKNPVREAASRPLQ